MIHDSIILHFCKLFNFLERRIELVRPILQKKMVEKFHCPRIANEWMSQQSTLTGASHCKVCIHRAYMEVYIGLLVKREY